MKWRHLERIWVGIILPAASCMLLVANLGCAQDAQQAEIKMIDASFAKLEKDIASYKGKVVVLDVWGEF